MFRQDLDGDDSIEPGVAPLVDFAHPACAERRDDFVRAEASARRKCHDLNGWRILQRQGRRHNRPLRTTIKIGNHQSQIRNSRLEIERPWLTLPPTLLLPCRRIAPACCPERS